MFPASLMACGNRNISNKAQTELSSKKSEKDCCKETSKDKKGCTKKCRSNNCQCPTRLCITFISSLQNIEFIFNIPTHRISNYKNTLDFAEKLFISIWSPPKIN